jgi:hypothetical protein
MTAQAKEYFMFALVIAALAVLFNSTQIAHAQSFDSGSNGSDGALNLTTPGTIEFDPTSFNPPLDPDGDNIYHFTTITIASGVTVRLTAKHLNGPVFWLASGAVQINGTIDLSGGQGHPATTVLADRKPSIPGAGGYPGGVGSLGTSPAQPGSGPGGGQTSGGSAGYAAPGRCGSIGPPGPAYGNNFLVPLLGGSGGAGVNGNKNGGTNFGGGAGGGAILLASSVSITVNGAIVTNGSGDSGGGQGSGGAIRLVAPPISGTGVLSASVVASFQCASDGRIRLEAFQQNFTGTTNPARVLASPFALFLPTTPAPSVRVVNIDGQPVPANPMGSFTVPDVAINKSAAVTVQIAASNIPPGTVVKLYISSENAPDQTIDSLPLAGTLATSTATASVVLPPGFSRGFVRATWATQ